MRPTPRRGEKLGRRKVTDGQGYFIDAVEIFESEAITDAGIGSGVNEEQCNCGAMTGARGLVDGRWADFEDDPKCIVCARQWGSNPWGMPRPSANDRPSGALSLSKGSARADAVATVATDAILPRSSEQRRSPPHGAEVPADGSRVHVEPRNPIRRAAPTAVVSSAPRSGRWRLTPGKSVVSDFRRGGASVSDSICTVGVASSVRRRRRRSARWTSTHAHVNILCTSP